VAVSHVDFAFGAAIIAFAAAWLLGRMAISA
jgi:hypothetical protein